MRELKFRSYLRDPRQEVELPWKGTYAVEVAVVDNTPGTHGTAPYDGMRLVTILTFKIPDGLAGPARPPVVTPKR